MTDIVERLRSPEIQRDIAAAYICIEAADEIERLRKVIIQAIAEDGTSLESMMQQREG